MRTYLMPTNLKRTMHQFSIATACLSICTMTSVAMAQPGTPTALDTGGSVTAGKSQIAEGGNETKGYDMAPETRPEIVQAAVAAIPDTLPAGPVQPTWESLQANYHVPA